MQIQTALTKENARSRTLEFASISENSVTRTQIEMRDGLVFMRAKRRSFVITE